ncbi:MAG: hypothetical protein IT385_00810 [Deltaproteobacteria bacterium]|nr:hypothetical protein [Deltaproteobacteria bacterium]
MTRTTTRWLPRALLIAAALAGAGCHDEPTDTLARPGELGNDSLALACAEDRTCPDGGTCDPATLRCVMCAADADCPAGRCDPATRACVQCVADDDCETGACHPTRRMCVRCWQDAHCEALTAAGGAGVCHPDLLSCVECLADDDCPGEGARCNADTLGCVAGCTRDAQCDDNDPCTDDACDGGVCGYAKRADCGCPAVTIACPRGAAPTDTNADGCDDACLCEGGDVIRPDGACPCPEPPACPVGTTLVDADRDGCADACACPNGAVIGADGQCPCPREIACEGGLVASDLDGDACPETCTKPCAADCDCDAQGLVAAVPCPLACPLCGPFLVCEAGVCQGRCGIDDGPPCKCPSPPACGPLETAVDTDLDGCSDTCVCLVPPEPGGDACGCPFAVACGPDLRPIDKDLDGCADACLCEATGLEPGPDGSCCEALACPPGATPTDTGGTSCDDACLCPDGSRADPSGIVAPCPCLTEAACDGGALPTDTNEDGCADACLCEGGEPPGPSGCKGCLSTCDGVAVPERAVYVDVDADGCYDLLESCPVGTTPATSPGAGCPDTCAGCPEPPLCPPRATAVDTDGDNCPDACRCEGGAPAPGDGCPCVGQVLCAGPATALDRDLDGCADGCAVSCVNACDCADAAKEAAFDSPECAATCGDCRITGACVEGFCAYACAANDVVSLCAVTPEDPAVCGCDDVTYTSACEADKAGVTVKRDGACDTSGCVTDADCADGELCEAPTGVCPEATDPTATPVASRGECQPIPTSCVGNDAPVCGCDGKTYPNDCERRRAGVARAKLGSCE